jgi:hypothetical protein
MKEADLLPKELKEAKEDPTYLALSRAYTEIDELKRYKDETNIKTEDLKRLKEVVATM